MKNIPPTSVAQINKSIRTNKVTLTQQIIWTIEALEETMDIRKEVVTSLKKTNKFC
jgi:hypothetical protein